jgi:hypothetical protein
MPMCHACYFISHLTFKPYSVHKFDILWLKNSLVLFFMGTSPF